MELTASGAARRIPGVRFASATAAREQAVVAAGQVVAGGGNLVFSLVMARVLAPGSFAEIASFLAIYSLLGLPGASISAVASLRPDASPRARRRTLAAGALVGLALAACAGWVGPLIRLPTAMVVVLGLSAPALG
ncbi:MAG: hypothetical protein ACRDV8_12945, partial [Acidimicrobiales bacterium]